MTSDEAIVALATTTGLSPAEWQDFLACTPDQQAAIAQTYRDASWVQRRDTFAEVLAILGAAATVAGAVSGLAGAYEALRAL